MRAPRSSAMRKTTMLNMGAFRLNYLVIALAATPSLAYASFDQDGCFREEYGGVTCSGEARAKKKKEKRNRREQKRIMTLPTYKLQTQLLI